MCYSLFHSSNSLQIKVKCIIKRMSLLYCCYLYEKTSALFFTPCMHKRETPLLIYRTLFIKQESSSFVTS